MSRGSGSVEKRVTLELEAEYAMLCFAGMQVEWLRALLASIGFPQAEPTIVFEDNQAAIGIAMAPSLPRKTRHIATKFHYTKSLAAKGVIAPTYIDTLLNHADMISKAKFPSSALHRRALARDVFNNTRARPSARSRCTRHQRHRPGSSSCCLNCVQRPIASAPPHWQHKDRGHQAPRRYKL